MSKQRKSKDEAAVAMLRDRLLLTIRFIENAQDFPSGQQLREIVEVSAAKGDLRTLRLIAREIDDMMIALAPHERDGLEALLLSRFGIDKDSEREELGRWAASILERGTIRSEKERRRLEDYVEQLTATGGDPAQIQAVTSLLQSS